MPSRDQRIELKDLSKSYTPGTKAVDNIDLVVESGQFMVLVGPSGCGKSTLLRMIAGLEEVTTGRVLIGGRDVTDLAPRHRDIAMIFQDYALYPHMSVRQNLAYGLQVRHTPRADVERRVKEVAGMLRLEDLLDRRPGQLSGGQRQRVAIGRAIARQPIAYLMDEPLSNLDAQLRVRMRSELARLHSRLGTTTIYVTHDQVEAMTLGQRVTVMNHGRIEQVGPPKELYADPASIFVAGFIGSPSMNLIEGTVELDRGIVSFGSFSLPLAADRRPTRGGRVVMGLRPGDLHLSGKASAGLPRIEVELAVAEDIGTQTHAVFWMDGVSAVSAEVRAAAESDIRLLGDDPRPLFVATLPGSPQLAERMTLAVDTSCLHFFDATTGLSLRRHADRETSG